MTEVTFIAIRMRKFSGIVQMPGRKGIKDASDNSPRYSDEFSAFQILLIIFQIVECDEAINGDLNASLVHKLPVNRLTFHIGKIMRMVAAKRDLRFVDDLCHARARALPGGRGSVCKSAMAGREKGDATIRPRTAPRNPLISWM